LHTWYQIKGHNVKILNIVEKIYLPSLKRNYIIDNKKICHFLPFALFCHIYYVLIKYLKNYI
jgi:hypothetical protein